MPETEGSYLGFKISNLLVTLGLVNPHLLASFEVRPQHFGIKQTPMQGRYK